MAEQTETVTVNPTEHASMTLEGLSALADIYHDALFMEADLQRAYAEAQSLTQYRRDEVVFDAYQDGHISDPNERQRRLRETMIIADDPAVGYLEWYEEQALKALILATAERKRIEAEIGLTKAWLYSQSGLAGM